MRSVILMYHGVSEPTTRAEARFFCPPARFSAQLSALLAEAGVQFVPLREVVRPMGTANDDKKTLQAAVTLDDGYADNYDNALPVLQTLGIPATVFQVAGLVGGASEWTNPRRPLLDAARLRALHAAAIEIGSHTVTHPRLPSLDEQAARREMADSKARLEDLLGARVVHFAYPYGAFGSRDAWLAADCGYELACSTRPGFNRPGENLYALRRIEVYGTDSPAALLRKVRFGTNDGRLATPLQYYARRTVQRLAALGGR